MISITDAKTKLKQTLNITFIDRTCDSSVAENENIRVKTESNNYTANHVFDSRIPKEFLKRKEVSTLL